MFEWRRNKKEIFIFYCVCFSGKKLQAQCSLCSFLGVSYSCTNQCHHRCRGINHSGNETVGQSEIMGTIVKTGQVIMTVFFLTLNKLGKNYSRWHFEIFFSENRLWHFMQIICMKCQSLFWRYFAWSVKAYFLGKIRKIWSVCCLLSLPKEW